MHVILFAEQPYDSIPNFSAADALRLTGIGRNEFIDIMNKCRSKVLIEFACFFMGHIAVHVDTNITWLPTHRRYCVT